MGGLHKVPTFKGDEISRKRREKESKNLRDGDHQESKDPWINESSYTWAHRDCNSQVQGQQACTSGPMHMYMQCTCVYVYVYVYQVLCIYICSYIVYTNILNIILQALT